MAYFDLGDASCDYPVMVIQGWLVFQQYFLHSKPSSCNIFPVPVYLCTEVQSSHLFFSCHIWQDTNNRLQNSARDITETSSMYYTACSHSTNKQSLKFMCLTFKLNPSADCKGKSEPHPTPHLLIHLFFTGFFFSSFKVISLPTSRVSVFSWKLMTH